LTAHGGSRARKATVTRSGSNGGDGSNGNGGSNGGDGNDGGNGGAETGNDVKSEDGGATYMRGETFGAVLRIAGEETGAGLLYTDGEAFGTSRIVETEGRKASDSEVSVEGEPESEFEAVAVGRIEPAESESCPNSGRLNAKFEHVGEGNEGKDGEDGDEGNEGEDGESETVRGGSTAISERNSISDRRTTERGSISDRRTTERGSTTDRGSTTRGAINRDSTTRGATDWGTTGWRTTDRRTTE
jgi:hypothetical protein